MADTISNVPEILSLVSLICYVLAGVFLAVAIFLFFYFKIPGVIGELTGRTARKTVARMRSANEKSGSKGFRPSETNAARGKVTGSMPLTGKKDKPQRTETLDLAPGGEETVSLGIDSAPLYGNRPAGEGTVPLAPGPGAGGGTELPPEETTALSDETTALSEETTLLRPAAAAPKLQFTLLEEVMLIHTDEVID